MEEFKEEFKEEEITMNEPKVEELKETKNYRVNLN